MLSSHIIKACVLANLDIGHQFGRRHEVPVGAATFAARTEHGEVSFTLDTFVRSQAGGFPGHKVTAVINEQLTVWPRDSATSAALIHRTDLRKAAD